MSPPLAYRMLIASAAPHTTCWADGAPSTPHQCRSDFRSVNDFAYGSGGQSPPRLRQRALLYEDILYYNVV